MDENILDVYIPWIDVFKWRYVNNVMVCFEHAMI